MDGLFADVRRTPWGAVVTDGRFPRIWDANYARVDHGAPSLDEVAADLTPALRDVGATAFHVVAFDPDEAAEVLVALSARGHRLGWDLVMQADPGQPPPGLSPARVEELPPGDELWEAVARSLLLFGNEPGEAVAQLRRIETEVLAPGGKRWFGARDDTGAIVSLAALLQLESVGYLDNIATEPAARGRGLASAVTARAMEEAAAAGAAEVFLLVDPDDAPVVAMYGRLGFGAQGRIASTRGPIPDEEGQSTNL
jgi:ribosomal protein S18 acetylase RimI-like enzyme